MSTNSGPLERLASAISDPTERPQYLADVVVDGRHSKKAVGWASTIGEAVDSGRPFMVRASPTIVVIDDDNGPVSAPEFIEEHPVLLGDSDPVLCQSGGGEGRWHLFIRVSTPLDGDEIVGAAKQFGLKDVQRGRWIRPPMSPHPSGDTASSIFNMTVDEAVAALSPKGLPGKLGRKALDALYGGPASAAGGDRSSVLMSATLGMVARNWDEAEIFDVLLAHPGGESLRARIDERGWSEAQTRTWFERYTLAAAKARCEASPTVRSVEDAVKIITSARRWMEARAWKGSGGNTDRLVLGYLLDLAEGLHRTHGLGVSQRQIADEVGVTHPTAGKSLKRLAAVGIIRRLSRHETIPNVGYAGPLANRYTIIAPSFSTLDEKEAWEGSRSTDCLHPYQSDPGGVRATGKSEDVRGESHDVFRWGGLGKAAYRVWAEVVSEPLAVSDIAARLQKSPSAVRAQLRKLAEHGMATEESRVWSGRAVDLDEVAQSLGVMGRAESQRQRHRDERVRARTKHGTDSQVPTCRQFAETMVYSAPFDSVSERHIEEVFYRWLMTLNGRGPRSSRRRFDSTPWADIQYAHPYARRVDALDGPVWVGICVRSPRNLPHLPEMPEIPIGVSDAHHQPEEAQ